MSTITISIVMFVRLVIMLLVLQCFCMFRLCLFHVVCLFAFCCAVLSMLRFRYVSPVSSYPSSFCYVCYVF